MDDQTIISLFLNRKEQAIQESETAYGSYCRYICKNILQNAEDAEECVNDTWLHAWNAIPPTIPKVLRLFLGRISRNLALNRCESLTAEKRGGTVLPVALHELEECIGTGEEAMCIEERTVLTETLNEFLRTLPNEKRLLFVKRYWYFEPVKDIAAELHLSESKVKMTLLRTQKQLAGRLEKEGFFE